MANGLLHNSVRIPGWAITTVVLVVAVLAAGIRIGRTWNEMESRMCRIERALDIPVWPGCPVLRSDR